ncbi:MAG TPA: hypothetical protein PKC18_16810, partial [Lacipirellulaceae bacterium]|nr:hypothetical protein [Lacipirellulaceae bacterium]
RRDVHEAVAVVLPDDATDAAAEERAALGRLTLADGAEVEYRLAGATVERLAVGTGVGPPRLDFAIAARSELSLERLEAPPRLTLQLRTGTGPPGELPQRPPVGPPPMTLEATAVIGRFAAPRQENEP